MSDGHLDDMGTRTFWGGAFLLCAVLLGASLHLARLAFFADDDFRWLSTVRAPDFSLIEAYLPLGERTWWAYRPLSMHTYFYVNQAAFGLTPIGFYCVSLLVHFGGGLLLYRLARQLGFAAEVAAATALLGVSRPPSMEVVYWASAFNYFSVATLSLLCVVLFGEWERRTTVGWRLGSVGALLLALLCQESALLLPGVLFAGALAHPFVVGPESGDRQSPPWPVAFRRALSRTAPHFAVAFVYATYRFWVIAPFARQGNYQSIWGWNLARNSVRYLEWVAGGELALVVLVIVVVALPPLIAWRGPADRAGLRALLALDAICLVWIAATLLPFVPVRMTAPRFAIAVEVPLCLLAGAQLAVAWRLAGVAHRRWLRFALLGLLMIATPYGAVRKGIDTPRGAAAKPVFEFFSPLVASLPVGSQLVLLYGGDDLALNAWQTRRETWTGTPLLSALRPGAELGLVYRDVENPKVADLGPTNTYFALRFDGKVETATADSQAEFFRSGLESHTPGIANVAAQRLALLLGPEAVHEIWVAAGMRSGPARERVAQALLLIEGPYAAGAAHSLIPDVAKRRALRERLERRWADLRERS